MRIFNDKGKIREQFVQRTISNQLNRAYYGVANTFLEEEVYTRDRKRADVLFAFRRLGVQVYICVIEAKSKDTLGNLKPIPSSTRSLNRARAIMIFCVFIGLLIYDQALVIDVREAFLILSGIIAVTESLKYGLAATGRSPFMELPALEQLRRYPANEKWLAISSDTFESEKELKILRYYCRRDGIGLIEVNAAGKMTPHAFPKPKLVGNDYAHKYLKQEDILANTKPAKNFRSPFEKKQNTSRILRYGTIVLAMTFMTSVLQPAQGLHPTNSDKINSARYHSLFPASTTSGTQSEKTNSRPSTIIPVTEKPVFKPDSQLPDSSLPKSGKSTPAPVKVTPPIPKPAVYAAADFLACDVWQDHRRQFIVYDKLFRMESQAIERLSLLRANLSVRFSYTLTNCFDDWMPQNHYLIVTTEIYSSRAAADQAANQLKQDLVAVGITHGRIRSLEMDPVVFSR